jgi:hypothetical protein
MSGDMINHLCALIIASERIIAHAGPTDIDGLLRGTKGCVSRQAGAGGPLSKPDGRRGLLETHRSVLHRHSRGGGGGELGRVRDVGGGDGSGVGGVGVGFGLVLVFPQPKIWPRALRVLVFVFALPVCSPSVVMGGLEMRRSGDPIFLVGTLGGAGAGGGSANTCMLSVPLPAFLPLASCC